MKKPVAKTTTTPTPTPTPTAKSNGKPAAKKVAKKSPKLAPATKPGETSLVVGLFRPGSQIAELYTALKAKPRTWVVLEKMQDNVRARVYRLKSLGSEGQPKFKVVIDDDTVRVA